MATKPKRYKSLSDLKAQMDRVNVEYWRRREVMRERGAKMAEIDHNANLNSRAGDAYRQYRQNILKNTAGKSTKKYRRATYMGYNEG